jgi:hypothetical protein
MADQSSLPPPKPYPRGFFLVSGEPDPAGFTNGARLLLMVRTTFAGIGNAGAFSAQLTSGAAVLAGFKAAPAALGTFLLLRPTDDARIANLVSRDLAAILNETPVGDGTTRVALMMRGFTNEQVLELDRWQLPVAAWSVAGGTVESRSVGVLGYK